MSYLAAEAMDLSIKPSPVPANESRQHNPSIFRPTPRPAWSILWYQSLWPTSCSRVNNDSSATKYGRVVQNTLQAECSSRDEAATTEDEDGNKQTQAALQYGWRRHQSQDDHGMDLRFEMSSKTGKHDHCSNENSNKEISYFLTQGFGTSIVTDVATCDGPVRFERISNPNFALTVEHHHHSMKLSADSDEPTGTLSSTTYICVYCKQGFKSLFCYQKHKKRHLNPVTVDITASNVQESTTQPETTSCTRDLNVQFFPCKECGCKFPSYYFVHKHKKICHK